MHLSYLFFLWSFFFLFSLSASAQNPEKNDGRILFDEAWPDRADYLKVTQALSAKPAEMSSHKSSAGWEQIPFRALRANSPSGSFWSGRVVDIDFFPGDSMPYVLSASGGLFRWDATRKWVPITQRVTSPAGGAFAVCPSNRDFIVLGTGEFTQSDGTGLWITRDGGESWFQPDSFPHASARNFFRIFFDPVDDSLIHIASSAGYFQSFDGGRSFIRKRTGRVCWVEQSTSDPDLLYAAVLQSGVYKSTDKGNTWQLLNCFSDANLGKTRIAICPSDQQTVYIHGARYNDQKTKGFYFSHDGGLSWDTARVFMDGTFQSDWHYGQGNYDNALAISPDCRDVLAAGVPMIRAYPVDSVVFTYFESNHVDVHDIVFRDIPGGYEIWNANDGGIARYRPGTDTRFIGAGVNEYLPITQMYEHDGDKKQIEKIAIATQDNMVAVRLYNTSPGDWMTIWGGDGFSVALDNSNTDRFMARANQFVFRTFNYGQTFSGIGAAPDPDFRTDRVRFDFNDPATAYASCENNLARQIVTSTDHGSTWTQLNSVDFSANIQNVSIGAGAFPNLYVLSWSATGDRLWVRDRLDGSWYERSADIVSSQRIEFVMPDVTDPDIALAYMNGNSTALASQKLFYTEDAGRSWVNVSGDLPQVPVRSAIIYPYNRNIMVLGTYGAGMYITKNGGLNWEPWNKGMSPFTYVYSRRSFSWVDSTSSNGKFYIIAGTYGNGLYYREISDSDTESPSRVSELIKDKKICDKLKYKFEEYILKPDLSLFSSAATIELTDLSGRSVITQAGSNYGLTEFKELMRGLLPGVYIISLTTGNIRCNHRWMKTSGTE